MPYSEFGPLVGAIDEGTSSARFIIFKVGTSEIVTSHQIELEQQTPQEGWVEQDAMRILSVVEDCMEGAVKKLTDLGGSTKDIVAIGITNQRETTVVWDKITGKPLYNAILWLDTRTTSTIDKLMKKLPSNCNENFFKWTNWVVAKIFLVGCIILIVVLGYTVCGLSPTAKVYTRCRNPRTTIKSICGLRIATYFSAVKLNWLIDNVTDVRKAVEEERCLFGTIDTWLLWKLTNKHITDVTNASRTMLMNIETLQWDPRLLNFFEIPASVLPEIRSSSEVYGHIQRGSLKGIPVSGCLGDQQAALLGQQCLRPGEAKATYGTGCFILYNIGNNRLFDAEGLITTVAYQLGPKEAPCYALEGSVAVAGLALDWLRLNLEVLDDVSNTQSMIEEASDIGSVVFVPAFSGLFAPYWQSDARGVISGISEDTEAHHIVKAALEAICFQVKDIMDVMSKECGLSVYSLKADGGMTANDFFLQTQADLGGFDVVKAGLSQSTALGAAMVAQWGVGHGNPNQSFIIKEGRTYKPMLSSLKRDIKYKQWKKALERSLGWNVTNS